MTGDSNNDIPCINDGRDGNNNILSPHYLFS